MAPGSTGSRKAARGSSNRLRTALACVGAVACVAASASGSIPFDNASVQSSGSQAAGAADTTGAPSRAASPAAYIRPDRAPSASELLSNLALQGAHSADVAPSWLDHVAPSGATGGSRTARQLSSQVLEGTAPAGISSSALGIPGPVLAAYHDAADDLARTDPSCGVPWWLLAGIGRIESGHASGGRVDANGTTLGRILGPRLDGSMAGNAVIHDSDGGAYDGDPHYDRAVGPMQFLPGTWKSVRSDGNGDGVTDPNNVYDATLGAARYLCLGGADLRTPAGLSAAVLRYNNSMDYVRSVLTWGQAYRDGDTAPVKSATGRVPVAVNPRQAPDEPPATPARSHQNRKTTKPHSNPPATKDDAPVVADGPRKSANSTPRPSSTVPPTKRLGAKGGSPKGGSSSSKGTPNQGNGGSSTTPPSTKPTTPPSTKPTTPPSSTNPPPSKTPTDPPTTGTPTPTPVEAGTLWPATASDAPTSGMASLETSAGSYTVHHSVLTPTGTLEKDGAKVKAAKDARLWLVSVDLPAGAPSTTTARLQVSGGKATLSLTGSGKQVVAAVVPEGGTVTLTVTTPDATRTIDVSTGTPGPPTWTHTAEVPADQALLASATASQGGYTAELQGLQLLQAHRTSWEPGYGTAPEGSQWLVLPYTMGSSSIAPKGYAQSTWASAGLTATTASGEVPAVASDRTTPEALSGEGGTLVFKVPVNTSSATIGVTPEVTVIKDGAEASADPLTLDPGLTVELHFG